MDRMLKNHIPYDRLKFHPHSFADPDGRLFWFEGELYRAISHQKTPFFDRLFEEATIPYLIERGLLIQSERTGLVLEGYGMVLRHRLVPFTSYPNEWCAAMFKDAALTYLKLFEELIPRGLTLKDTHPWNLLFEGAKPVYVDITSIKQLTLNSRGPDFDKFCRYYVYPIMLMSREQGRIARHLLPDYEGIQASDFSLLTGGHGSPLRLTSRLQSALHRRLKSVLGKQTESTRAHFACLGRMRSAIEKIHLPAIPVEDDDSVTSSNPHLLETISKLKPESVLAVGARTQWYAALAARLEIRVIVFNTDSAYITQLYRRARDQQLQLLPLIMDFTDPTPSRGLSNHLSIAASERLQCDLVLALGLVNEAVSGRNLRFEQIVDGLVQFSKRWVIVDYLPSQSPKIGDGQSEESCRYRSDSFIGALKKRFHHVSSLPSEAETHTLFLCEK